MTVQLYSIFTIGKHKISIFFKKLSIVLRQILNIPQWAKGLIFIFQTILIQARLI